MWGCVTVAYFVADYKPTNFPHWNAQPLSSIVNLDPLGLDLLDVCPHSTRYGLGRESLNSLCEGGGGLGDSQ